MNDGHDVLIHYGIKGTKAFSQVKTTDISDAALAKGRNYINMLDRSDLDRR